jgi:PST family polysaccharide transporter
VSWGIVTVILSWFCIERFGMTGAGLAFFLSYVFHGFMLYAIVSRLIGFRWSAENWRVCLISLGLVTIVFGGFFVLPLYYAVAVGVVAAILSGIFSVRSVMSLIKHEEMPAPIRKVMRLLRITSSRMEA